MRNLSNVPHVVVALLEEILYFDTSKNYTLHYQLITEPISKGREETKNLNMMITAISLETT
jgi:hypothetical protein